MKRPGLLILVLLLVAVSSLPAQELPEEPKAPALLQALFFTFQYGGGVMTSAGGGFGFFDNIVRPEVLIGYTPSGNLEAFSITAKLNARVLEVPVSDAVGIYGTIGTSFTYFSANALIVSAAFLAQEIDLRGVLPVRVVTLYFEENVYFIQTTEGNAVFQLGIGLRVHPF